ncbi:MAG: V-type ATP synthase subunit D [Candidatus Cloacimonetes bacterium HGW-Cloacimonetes-2]|jgi:V/A-type H+-transporting ATPase subunit D|nr:MAG: V-type ATP synthase subunit D [Candidatus Cloacimonetes bacterium HGW-Cloacimonetes-2]
MSLKFQYNKTALQELNKQLKVRIKALPTLKNKESALRLEVKRARDKVHELDLSIQAKFNELNEFMKLYTEFDPSLVKIREIDIQSRKIAGVQTPLLGKIEYELAQINLFRAPTWFLDGVQLLKQVSELQIEQRLFQRKMQILEHVRKKTTQKVNLYEKVQIPAFEEGILKIKRFLEDEENLSKAGQKILKNRMSNEAAL